VKSAGRMKELDQILRSMDSLKEEESDEGVPFIDASALREEQKSLLDLLFQEDDKYSDKTIGFVLYHLIEDIFYNLSGDVQVNDEISKIQVDYLKRFTENCRELRQAIDMGKPESVNFVLQSMISDFFSSIKKIDKQGS
jgi:hypothetical protein